MEVGVKVGETVGVNEEAVFGVIVTEGVWVGV